MPYARPRPWKAFRQNPYSHSLHRLSAPCLPGCGVFFLDRQQSAHQNILRRVAVAVVHYATAPTRPCCNV